MDYLRYVLEFVLAFTVVYLFYKIVVISKMKKSKKKKDKELPTEAKLFLNLNKIKEEDVDRIKLMNQLAILNGVDVAIILLLTEITSSFALKVVIAFIAIFVVMIASYKALGALYKKGIDKNVRP